MTQRPARETLFCYRRVSGPAPCTAFQRTAPVAARAMFAENPAYVRASRSASRLVLSGRGASDVNGQAVPAAARRPCVTSDAGPRPIASPPQREGREATENVQGSQQASRRSSGRRRLHRAAAANGAIRSGSAATATARPSSPSTSDGWRTSTICCVRSMNCADAISCASARRTLATAISCCGSPTLRARCASRGGAPSRPRHESERIAGI